MAGSHLNGHGHFVMVRGVGGIISAVSMAYLKNAFVLMAAMALGCSLTSKPGEKGGLSDALSNDPRIKPGMTRNQIERILNERSGSDVSLGTLTTSFVAYESYSVVDDVNGIAKSVAKKSVDQWIEID